MRDFSIPEVEHRAALLELMVGIKQQGAPAETPDVNADDRELRRCLMRATNLQATVDAINSHQVTFPQLVANRIVIHETFGAPGDWGYHTAIGAALQRLYGIDYKQMPDYGEAG